MKYSLTELLGCRYPVIQGAMGVSGNPEFVATVLEAVGAVSWPRPIPQGDPSLKYQSICVC